MTPATCTCGEYPLGGNEQEIVGDTIHRKQHPCYVRDIGCLQPGFFRIADPLELRLEKFIKDCLNKLNYPAQEDSAMNKEPSQEMTPIGKIQEMQRKIEDTLKAIPYAQRFDTYAAFAKGQIATLERAIKIMGG